MRPFARSSAMRASMPSVPSAASTASTWFSATTAAWPTIIRTHRVQQRESVRDVGAVAPGWRKRADRSFAHQNLRRHLVGAEDAEAVILEQPSDARKQVIVAAAIHAPHPRQQAEHAPVRRAARGMAAAPRCR